MIILLIKQRRCKNVAMCRVCSMRKGDLKAKEDYSEEKWQSETM